MTKIDYLRGIISTECILRNDKLSNEVVSKNGRPSKWMFDIRQILFSPKKISLIAEIFWDKCEGLLPFQVCGLELSSVPLITAIQSEGLQRGYDINGFVVRKERKTSGYCRQYEGLINAYPLIIIDDILNSGNSVEKILSIEDLNKIAVKNIFCLVDFERKNKNKIASDLNVISIFTLSEFSLELTEESGFIKDNIDLNWAFIPDNINYAVNLPRSNPIYHNGKILFGSSNSKFYALTLDGKVEWEFATGYSPKGIISSPALHESTIFFGCYDGTFYALNADSGEVKWENSDCDYIGSSPIIAEDISSIFVGYEYGLLRQRGAVVRLDLETGKLIWSNFSSDWVHASPVYIPSQRSVICGTNKGEIISLNAGNGEPIWITTIGSEIKAGIAYDEVSGTLVFGAFDGSVYCLEVETGNIKWQTKTGGKIYSTPIIVDGSIYCGSTDRIFYILNHRNGEIEDSHETMAKIYGSPARHGDYVWFGGCDGSLNAINVNSKKIERRIMVAERLLTRPLILRDELYIGGAGGIMFAFSL